MEAGCFWGVGRNKGKRGGFRQGKQLRKGNYSMECMFLGKRRNDFAVHNFNSSSNTTILRSSDRVSFFHVLQNVVKSLHSTGCVVLSPHVGI